MRLNQSIWTLALLITPAVWAQPQPAADWRFADPGAHLIGGLDVQAILNSPLVKAALDQVAGKMGPTAPAMQLTLGTLSGITQMYFSITARQDDPEAVMMIKGTLDDAAARAFIQGAAAGSAQTTAGTKTPPQPKADLLRVDAATILLGSPSLLTAAKRRMERPASAQLGSVQARAAKLAAGNDFWIGGTLPDIPALALIAGGIKGLSFGLSLQRDLHLQVSLDMATAVQAEQMAAQIQKSINEAREKQNDLDMKVETKVEGETLRITASMEGDRILRAMADKLKDGLPAPGGLFGASPTAAATPTPAPKPAPKPAPRPQKVTIYGLEGGPKEIQFPPNRQ